MPLKLDPPRPGKTPNYYIRGTYLGVHINRSTGTSSKAVARQVLRNTKEEIECGQLAGPGELTFSDAALGYMHATGVSRFLPPILKHFGERPAASIDQVAVDEAARKLYPDAVPATLNRQVYTPVIAILHHSKLTPHISRPRTRQQPTRDWLWPQQARTLIHAGYRVHIDVGTLFVVLLFTGMRRSEAIKGMDWGRTSMVEQTALVNRTKNGTAREVYLHTRACRALRAIQNGQEIGPVFPRWQYSYKGLYAMLREAFALAEMPYPDQPLHIFRHTWATWMRRYGGGDRGTLVASGAWQSDKAASIYDHIVPNEAARLVDRFPMRG
ncbi:MAG: tyrosine-type recombinase/integrase [Pseudomonadota bacterium]